MAKKIGLAAFLSILFFSCSSAPEKRNDDPYLYGSHELLGRSGQALEAETRMIAYSISLELVVKNPGEIRAVLAGQVKTSNGFIVRDSEKFITARIPAENMDSFLNSVRQHGKVKNEIKTGTDITDQYRDNAIKLESLKNVRHRYLALLEKANSVADMLSIEKELERINTEIEVLEGKLKYAELSAAYSNITVVFGENKKPGPLGWLFYGLYQGIKWLFVWG